MEPSLSQDSLSSLLLPTEASLPVTPDPPHATLPANTTAAVSRSQASLVDASNHMTPPPSTQVPSSQRGKSRTPTPTASHISTPPPTIELPSQTQQTRSLRAFTGMMPAEYLASATLEELRGKVMEMQAALQEAKMTAAHHKLQYQMLSQESAAAIERMSVEARMAQQENDIIQEVNQARAAATPVQTAPFPDGMIPVQKDLYQRMCREIRDLTDERNYLADEHARKDRILMRQDCEIASLQDKVMLMRERIREKRENFNRQRRSQNGPYLSSTPRTLYPGSAVSSQEQPCAALLQASEMASQEAGRPITAKKGHTRNTHSLSSLPTTPHRSHKQAHAFATPHSRHAPLKIPSTAPVPRTSAIRTPDIYSQSTLPVPTGPASDGTVSASEEDDDDSEAETDILSPSARHNDNLISESQASLTASQMLRPEHSQSKRESFKGRGMLEGEVGKGGLKQAKLFGAVRKGGAERDAGEPPAKRARTDDRESGVVGLGIAGVRQ